MADINSITFQHILFFLKIVECGTMSRAAEELHVTPSLLSQKTAQLEEIIGLKLFKRIKQRLILTDAGRQLATDFKDVSSRMEYVLDSAYERFGRTRPLTVGFTNYQGHSTIGRVMGEFRNTHDISVAIELLPRTQLQENFMNGMIDIICMADFDKLCMDNRLVCHKAGSIQFACVVNANSVLARKKSLSFEELDGAICILPEHQKNSAFLEELKKKLSAENAKMIFQFHGGDILTVKQLIRHNSNYITFAGVHADDNDSELIPFFLGMEYPFIVAHYVTASPDIYSYAETIYNSLSVNNGFV